MHNRTAIPVAAVRELVAEQRHELAFIRATLPDPAQHPTWHALIAAYCHHLEIWLAEFEQGREADASAWLEIRSWIMAEEPHPGEFADSLVRHGMSYTETAEVLKHAEEDSRGAPATRRQAFINGHEMHQTGATYRQITGKLCDCEKKAGHDRLCLENFKKGIQAVSKLLTKYQLGGITKQ